jgi:predicted alpha/beta hydrolase
MPTIEFKTEGLIFVSGLSRTHTGLWSRYVTRTQFTCKVSKQTFEIGTIAYRPMTNSRNRAHKIAGASLLDLLSGDFESLIKIIRSE